MIKHIWSVLTQKSIIEAETNSLSLIDVLEELTVGTKGKKDPSTSINVPISYEIVSFLVKEDKKSQSNPHMIINFINPDGKILKTFEHEIQWEAGKNRMRTRVRVTGLSIDISGVYNFKIGLKEKGEKEYKTVAEIPFEVKIVDEDFPPQKK